MIPTKRVVVNGTVYLRRLTAGQQRANMDEYVRLGRALKEAQDANVEAKAAAAKAAATRATSNAVEAKADSIKDADDSIVMAQDAKDPEAVARASEGLWQFSMRVVRAHVVGVQDPASGAEQAYDEGTPIEDQLDGVDLQELVLHCCGIARDAVAVVGDTPFTK